MSHNPQLLLNNMDTSQLIEKTESLNESQVDSSVSEFFKDSIEEIKWEGFTKNNLKKFFYKPKPDEAIPERPALISSAHGKLTHLLVAQLNASTPDCKLLEELSKQKPSGLEILTLVPKEANCTKATNIRLLNKFYKRSVDVWIQDMLAIAKETTKKVKTKRVFLFEWPDTKGIGEMLKQYEVSNNFELSLVKIPFRLAGGNILIGDRFLFINKTEVRHNSTEFGKNNILFEAVKNYDQIDDFDVAFRKIMREVVDPTRKWIEIEKIDISTRLRPELQEALEPKQFQEHLDFFLTLGGAYKRNKYLVFLAKPIKVSLGKSNLDDFFAAIPKWWKDTKMKIESLKTGKKGRRFKVVELPMPCFYKENAWFAYSYNNCVVQSTKKEKSVLLPVYFQDIQHQKKLKKQDKLAIRRFKQYGFKHVIPIRGLGSFLDNNKGALHCLTKDLYRK